MKMEMRKKSLVHLDCLINPVNNLEEIRTHGNTDDEATEICKDTEESFEDMKIFCLSFQSDDFDPNNAGVKIHKNNGLKNISKNKLE